MKTHPYLDTQRRIAGRSFAREVQSAVQTSQELELRVTQHKGGMS